MDTNEIKARVLEVQSEMDDLHDTRRELATSFAYGLGVEEDGQGLNLDDLSRWARQVRKINSRLKVLADERRELRSKKREIAKVGCCDCNCGCN